MPFDIPLLSDGSLTLRPHRASDVEPVFLRSVDPLTRQWTTIPLDYTRAMAAHYVAAISVAQDDAVSWALEFDGAYAGSLDLRFQGANSGNLGFVTAPAFRGRGLMSRAVSLAVTHAFDGLGWDVVTWTAHAGNTGSYKTVWRSGFPPPIAVPHFLAHRGRMVEGWISSLAAEDPRLPTGLWAEWHDVVERLPAAPVELTAPPACAPAPPTAPIKAPIEPAPAPAPSSRRP
ncbi:GNAT family N-acetyltransferase [Arthrobacter sp. zg-Y1219]|uniref:GNAT family N-acetyltransferase n=1 Tax=Arthrobacter sp. zg-Y1219 TaxID=3049067 RepID=UPI0024C2D2E3|nr:GNAT family N-acetyltransferase [Arthrobacter sp. zg-Y1219]MDK1359272.1 GNAT family N-acetyltransferase [Arthrobacter sp. zg-Y1219]